MRIDLERAVFVGASLGAEAGFPFRKLKNFLEPPILLSIIRFINPVTAAIDCLKIFESLPEVIR